MPVPVTGTDSCSVCVSQPIVEPFCWHGSLGSFHSNSFSCGGRAPGGGP